MGAKTITSRIATRAAAGLLVLLAACSSAGTQGEDGRLVAVATVSPITNLVANIGGPHVTVSGLVPEGTNSHEFEPAPSDARALARADVVFVNGLNLELPSIRLAEANVRPGVPIVRLAERTIGPDEYVYDASFPEEAGDPNPHLWTNPAYVAAYAAAIRDALTAIDPANATAYAERHDAYAARVAALDAAVRAATATVPVHRRALLTYHDSFPYFARDHGWEVIGAIQPADFSDPTAREVARLIDQIRARGLPAIFGSEVFPSPVLAQIAREAGARYVDDLRDDDLPGEDGDPEHCLLALLVFDFRTIVGALGGDPSALDAVDTTNLAGSGDADYRG